MGAHLSTVRASLIEAFSAQADGRGYLTLREVMALGSPYGVSAAHIGVLFACDADKDGRVTQQELQAFAGLAHAYARAHRGLGGNAHSQQQQQLDAGNVVQGFASLCLWRALRDEQGRRGFVDWFLKLIIEGHDTALIVGPQRPQQQQQQQHQEQLQQQPQGAGGLDGGGGSSCRCVHRRALKAAHALLEVQRNHGLDLSQLLELLAAAAEEQGLLDAAAAGSTWVALPVLRAFVEAAADGMAALVGDVFATGDELEDLLVWQQQPPQQQPQPPQQQPQQQQLRSLEVVRPTGGSGGGGVVAGGGGTRGGGAGGGGSSGGVVVPPLALHKARAVASV